MELNNELVFLNTLCEDNKMTVGADRGDDIIVAFQFSLDDELIQMNNDINPHYFHLDKFQVGILIDYLKRLHDEM